MNLEHDEDSKGGKDFSEGKSTPTRTHYQSITKAPLITSTPTHCKQCGSRLQPQGI